MESLVYSRGFFLLVFVCAFVSYYYRTKSSKSEDETLTPENSVKGTQQALYRKFKINYLTVYCLVMLSDWLQGPYIYNLYKSYGYGLDDIAVLFITGFLSSAVFGTYIGSVADKFGRKKMCLVFCLIYAISCLTKLSPSFSLLLLGRVTGGIATSLLFSVFEAWMVKEHFSRGFKEDLISDLFSWATFLNGLSAIFSGILANTLADRYGYVSPFMGAIVFLVIAGGIIFATWKENYGDQTESSGQTKIGDAIKAIRENFNIFCVGMMQCLFESAMYSFVFLWSPFLDKKKDADEVLPFGIIFSSFMVSIMIGSVVFRRLMSLNYSHEQIAQITFALASFSLFIPCFTEERIIVFFAFNLFEFCCGLYFPTIGTIRSKFVPEETRATTMNVFRVPLNLIVVLTLLKVDSIPYYVSFYICGSLVAVSYLFCSYLGKSSPPKYEVLED